MKFKYWIKEAWRFLILAFSPSIALIACFLFSLIVVATLGIVMIYIPTESTWYNFIFALTTGAVASFFVSFVVELTNNYRHNKQALYELQDYYSAITDYENQKQIMMQLSPSRIAEKKDIEELDEEDKPKDIIQIMWDQLPRLIPVLKNTYEEKKEFLEATEVAALNSILHEYKQIQFAIKMRIMMGPMLYDALNHPDETFLKLMYPEDVIKNMPEYIRRHLASNESKKALDRYVDAILSDGFLLSELMADYDISQQGYDKYQKEIDSQENKEDEIEIEDIDYEDEDSFRAQIEIFNKQMEKDRRSFESWHISNCCLSIADSLNIIEKSIQKKPYYGMMIKVSKKSAKRIAKQRESENKN